jgi:hypothetical protein
VLAFLFFTIDFANRQNTGHMGAAHALKEAKQRAAAGIRVLRLLSGIEFCGTYYLML